MTSPNPQEGGKEQGFLPESPSADAGPSPRSPEPPCWPVFDVSVIGFPAYPVTAPSRGKALARALSDYQNYDDRMSMGEFMRLARVRLRREPISVDGYDYVRRAYGVAVEIGQLGCLRNEGPDYNGRLVRALYPNSQSTAYVHVVDSEGRSFIVHPDSFAPAENGPGDRASSRDEGGLRDEPESPLLQATGGENGR